MWLWCFSTVSNSLQLCALAISCCRNMTLCQFPVCLTLYLVVFQQLLRSLRVSGTSVGRGKRQGIPEDDVSISNLRLSTLCEVNSCPTAIDFQKSSAEGSCGEHSQLRIMQPELKGL
ncbi:hypothetical protein EDD36DRAFT_218448 [Exophiala viscosa]|uniref:Uncharacterized protein n=1 Tax=Exophiala viscosa TaxID=2486360 RepID=A0AAN6DX20_9EURO|nr:hypothetical protein EDD36DRAFT_218448 [Exophiala viscosa]